MSTPLAAAGTLVVATDDRGRFALRDIDGVTTRPVPDSRAAVLWRRHGITGAEITEALPAMPLLRWLHTDTAGVDDLPLDELDAAGVTVTKTAAYTEAVAEWAVAAVLLAAKGLPAYVRASDAHRWEPAAGNPRLLGTTRAVIVGAGGIGARIGAMLRHLGVTVELVARAHTRSTWAEYTLPWADWLVLACPLTASTRGLIGADQLALLPTDAWVINAARGGVLDEGALLDALNAHRIGGAVLDTVNTEPLPSGSPLWGRPNVLVTPHDAWRARGAGRRQVADFRDQLGRYLGGKPLRRVVDAAQGY